MYVKHLSYSSVDQYETCPRMFQLRKTSKVPFKPNGNMVFGTAVHKAVQKLVQNPARRLVTKPDLLLLDFFEAAWAVEAPKAHLFSEEVQSLGELGRTLLGDRETARMLAHLPIDPGSIEKHVVLRVPEVDVPVIGFVDMISASVPIDIKTSSQRWPEKRATESLQPTIYLAALEQMGVIDQGCGMFWYFVFAKDPPGFQAIQTQRTETQRKSMIRRIQKVWRGIQADRFPCNNKSWKCNRSWCDAYDACDRGESEAASW